MARGSSSKVRLGLLLAFVMLHVGAELAMAQSRVWPVGDSKGWSPGVIEWPNYKPFKAGDVLEFSYNPQMHNVMVVDNLSYSMCKIPTNATVYSSGDDRITLSRGMTFFICGKPGHCESGMKIAVTAR